MLITFNDKRRNGDRFLVFIWQCKGIDKGCFSCESRKLRLYIYLNFVNYTLDFLKKKNVK